MSGRLDVRIYTFTNARERMDNYGTHNMVEVKAWLKAYPRFVTQAASCGWLNLPS